MTSANQEIVTAFEDNGLTPEQIAHEFEYDISSVKSILFQCSAIFRKAAKVDKTLDYSDEEFDVAKDVIMRYVKYGDDTPALQVKCALHVVTDKKGYLDPRRALPTLNVNVISFNDQLKKAQAAEARVYGMKEIAITSSAELVEDKK